MFALVNSVCLSGLMVSEVMNLFFDFFEGSNEEIIGTGQKEKVLS